MTAQDVLENDIRELRGANPGELAARLIARGWSLPAQAVEPGPLDVEAITGPVLARAWVLSGRPAPLIEPDEWDGFALTVRAIIETDKQPKGAG